MNTNKYKPIPTDQILYNIVKERVKSRVKRWPSAYASGQVVKEYKKIMEYREIKPYITDIQKDKKEYEYPLNRWYKEKWVDIKTNKPCGSVKTAEYYPTCRPSIRINSKTPTTSKELTLKQKEEMIKQKQIAKYKTVYYPQTKRYI